jgi:hypothetical protein
VTLRWDWLGREDAFHARARAEYLWLLYHCCFCHCGTDRSDRLDYSEDTDRQDRGRKYSGVCLSLSLTLISANWLIVVHDNSLRGRPHYYSTRKEDYANIRFSVDADLSSLFTWNTKQVFVYISAVWPANTTTATPGDIELGLKLEDENEAVIWDTIITNPSADHLQNISPAAVKKLVKSAEGKTIDPSRFVLPLPPKAPRG